MISAEPLACLGLSTISVELYKEKRKGHLAFTRSLARFTGSGGKMDLRRNQNLDPVTRITPLVLFPIHTFLSLQQSLISEI